MFNSILLQAGANSGIMQIVLFGGIFVVFYFFMIRPQQKKQKEQQQFVDSIKTGDKIVTIGGVHGTVITVREKTVVVEIDSSKGVRVVFEKTAVSKDASSRLGAE
ncbi:preprotein translocase subunit YajC [Pseudarcicella hirudinis]|uniref:Sec translocon accessory complex subunit YajC n=1 Tax=Pseudarcicella hirudinis TaxID=1079859 RepID=A0A1I5P276_9BACT|nr:preprotein translocase subunit YajC [Pseudarcicella hirudinis]SFP28073.1 preprotein translocase subunit YajC [Pseudarcicella hirudinis]